MQAPGIWCRCPSCYTSGPAGRSALTQMLSNAHGAARSPTNLSCSAASVALRMMTPRACNDSDWRRFEEEAVQLPAHACWRPGTPDMPRRRRRARQHGIGFLLRATSQLSSQRRLWEPGRCAACGGEALALGARVLAPGLRARPLAALWVGMLPTFARAARPGQRAEGWLRRWQHEGSSTGSQTSPRRRRRARVLGRSRGSARSRSGRSL
mmetsp:Transcript_109531/g.340005  ORF Transcript_109531/g.340005 Transcript_109531/m.340005 type:complete len:210 (+) Transcript_109531:283-912(+)